MGFTKLDERIIQSSIMGESPETFKVWITLLAICKSDGVAEVSTVFLESVCRIPIEKIEEAIAILSSEDKRSRSLNDDGRRIERVDGGFRIINYIKYRTESLKSAEAERKRLYREKESFCPDITGQCPDASASASDSGFKDRGSGGKEFKKFTPPTISEVQNYCLERKNGIDPDRFMAHYESNGWRVGKNPMKSWKAAVVTWEKSAFGPKVVQPPLSAPRINGGLF